MISQTPKLDESRELEQKKQFEQQAEQHIINAKDMLIAISDIFARLEGK